MDFIKLLLFLLLFHLHLFKSSHSECEESFQCGDYTMSFPLTRLDDLGCGLIIVEGCGSDLPKPVLRVGGGSLGYGAIEKNNSVNNFSVFDHNLDAQMKGNSCFSFSTPYVFRSPSIWFTVSPNITLFTCSPELATKAMLEDRFRGYRSHNCGISMVYYKIPAAEEEVEVPYGCSMVQLPMNSSRNLNDSLFDIITANYSLEWNVSEECVSCFNGGGQCLTDNEEKFYCKRGSNKLRVILLSTLIPIPTLALLIVAGCIWLRRKRMGRSFLLSRNLSYDPSSKSDVEDGTFSIDIPIFSYTELVDATGNFDPSKELGDGGFGTVYYGKLRDGREVAIKRLYEHNYKRVEQFLNEIKILTGLRHPNLVSLYGCTSRRSRELLLVYEYIPNGTVADHLHGERAGEAPLSWPVRMSIARETATALAYLHKSDIVHRDVKTNNILLDNNFSVKVADFGLSRLFPTNVTHISTAPQGTPGYVDPEYHQCYQLTDKSDVYSFGVVLIELISSMPAVDISRHKHEINLATLAVNKIQRCAFDELIDPSTGYNSDAEATRMTTSVAELAFRCLQLDKDMRPSMEEVVAFLHDVEAGDDVGGCGRNLRGKIPPSPETDEAVLLKSKMYQPSPTAVTDTWISSDSTTASSVG